MVAQITREFWTPKAPLARLYRDVSIRGEACRREDFLRFAHGVAASIEARSKHGVALEREPSNPEDPLAIKVVGFWTERRWLSKRRHTADLGYVPRRVAYTLWERTQEGRSLTAFFRGAEVNDDRFEVVIDILVS